MAWSLRAKIRFFALYSRLFIFALQFFSNPIITDYDYQNETPFQWIPDPPIPEKRGFADEFISFILDGLQRGESQYHLHIANNGYSYENALRYFPIYPLLLRIGSSYLTIFHVSSALKLASFILNSAAFLLSAEILYLLSRKVLNDEYLAYKSALFYCVNPSSVFFTASYPECLYSLFSFTALYYLETRGTGVLSAIFLALSSGTKDLGILNVGIVVYYSMKKVAVETILYVREKKKNPGTSIATTLTNISLYTFFPGICNAISGCAPFAAFQWFAYSSFCIPHHTAKYPSFLADSGYVMPPSKTTDSLSPWCTYDPPTSFFYVHSKYGHMGFRQYQDINQLPYILASIPVLGISCIQVYHFVSYNKRYTMRFGLIDNALLGIPKLKVLPMVVTQSLPRECFVYLLHAFTILISVIIFYPIQDIIRLLCSSSPVLYWIAALSTTPSQSSLVPIIPGVTTNDSEISIKVERRRNLMSPQATILFQEKNCSDLGNWVKLFFLGYFLLGTVMFSNNYPWT